MASQSAVPNCATGNIAARSLAAAARAPHARSARRAPPRPERALAPGGQGVGHAGQECPRDAACPISTG